MSKNGDLSSGEVGHGGPGPGLGPRRLAEFATRRPWRVLAAWGVLALVSTGLVGALLSSGVTSNQTLTNHPESYAARDLIDERLADQNKVDEVIVVRSEGSVVSDPAFARRVQALVGEARRSGSVRQIRSYLEPGGKTLVSADRHATILPVVLVADKAKRIDDLIPVIERANGSGGFAVHITGENTLGLDFTKVSESDLSKGELQFGLPAALLVLLLVFGTVTGALIPMFMAIVSIIVALGITAVVGQAFKLNLFITNMVVAMGLALGIDYSLFIVSRLREERRRGRSTAILFTVLSGLVLARFTHPGTKAA